MPASVFLSVLFSLITGIIIPHSRISSSTVSDCQAGQEKKTIRNEAYRFEITVPENWTFEKIVQQDPYEEMKTGLYTSTNFIDKEQEMTETWNGFKLISTDTTNDPQPFLIIYGHEVSDQKPEEFAALFKESPAGSDGNGLEANWNFSVGDAKGFDCTYGLFTRVRYSVLYSSGIRVIIMYFFPSADASLFYKHSSEVDEVIKSLRIFQLSSG